MRRLAGPYALSFLALFLLSTLLGVLLATPERGALASLATVPDPPPAGPLCDIDAPLPEYHETEHFVIQYTTASTSTHRLQNVAIETYGQALETAYATEVETHGWPTPPFCTAGATGCDNENPWDKYPIQVANLGSDVYGYVTTGGAYAGGGLAGPPSATCMVLHSDFAQIDGNPMDAVEATAAHEFHHMIQLTVHDFNGDDLMWSESTASYVEEVVFDNANIAYDYLWADYNACLGHYPQSTNPDIRGASEYTNWLLFEYMDEHAGGPAVMGNFLANISGSSDALQAYTAAVDNFDQAWHDYAIASFFMRDCGSAQAPYCFPEAGGYRAQNGDPPFIPQATLGSLDDSEPRSLTIADEYAMRAIELPPEGVYSVYLEPFDSSTARYRVSVVADLGNQLHVTPFPDGGTVTDEAVVLSDYEPPDEAQRVVAIVTTEMTNPADPGFNCNESNFYVGIHRPVVVLVDVSQSMEDEMGQVVNTVQAKVDELEDAHKHPTYHLWTYVEEAEIEYHASSEGGGYTDPAAFKNELASATATLIGNPDCPEELLDTLIQAADQTEYAHLWYLTDAGFHGLFSRYWNTLNYVESRHGTISYTKYDLNFWDYFTCYGWFDLQNAPALALADGADSVPALPLVAAGQTEDLAGHEAEWLLSAQTGGHGLRTEGGETPAATDVIFEGVTTGAELTRRWEDQTPAGAITDGSFEAGPPPYSGWTETSNQACSQIRDWEDTWGAPGHQGRIEFWAGGICDGATVTNSVAQTVTVPAGQTVFSFYYMTYRADDDDPVPDDYAYLSVDGADVWQLDLTQANDTRPNWEHVTVDLSAYAGQSVVLRLGAVNAGPNNGNIRYDDVRLQADATPPPPPEKLYTVAVDDSATQANFLLNLFQGEASLALTDPAGNLVGDGDTGVTVTTLESATLITVADPASGVWEATVTGEAIYTFSGAAQSDLHLAYLGDPVLRLGTSNTLLARLSGPVTTADFSLTTLDGQLLADVTLYDDGAHGDGAAGDGLYGGTYTPTVAGRFYIHAQGNTDDGAPYQRTAPGLLRVQTLGVTAPADQTVAAGDDLLYTFTLHNAGNTAVTYQLGYYSSTGWADLSGLPATASVPAGGSTTVAIPVQVPAGAAVGAYDVLALAAAHPDEPQNSATATVETTVGSSGLQPGLYLPLIAR